MEGFTIEGLEDCIKCLDAAPENVLKMTKTAMKKASSVTVRDIRSGVPRQWRKMVKSKVIKNTSGNLTALIGMFNIHEGTKGEAWFHAYWKNYGTLKGRDPNHKFDFPVKRTSHAVSSRNGESGEAYANFFETSIIGAEEKFLKEFENQLAKQEEQLYDR
jgi:hypothetical protein